MPMRRRCRANVRESGSRLKSSRCIAWWLALPLVTRQTRVQFQNQPAPRALEPQSLWKLVGRAQGQATKPQDFEKPRSEAGN